jgi:hypothetical protein
MRLISEIHETTLQVPARHDDVGQDRLRDLRRDSAAAVASNLKVDRP